MHAKFEIDDYKGSRISMDQANDHYAIKEIEMTEITREDEMSQTSEFPSIQFNYCGRLSRNVYK